MYKTHTVKKGSQDRLWIISIVVKEIWSQEKGELVTYLTHRLVPILEIACR